MKKPRIIIINGEKFGKLTILHEIEKSKSNHKKVKVQCECGVIKDMYYSSIIHRNVRKCSVNCKTIFPEEKIEFICSYCKLAKSKNQMCKDRYAKYGIKLQCKECNKKYRIKNFDKISLNTKKFKEKNKKLPRTFKTKTEYYLYRQKWKKEDRKKFPEKYKNLDKLKYDRDKNKLKTKEQIIKRRDWSKEYSKKRRQTDPIFKLKDRVRARVKKYLKSNKYENYIWRDLIGCSIEFLKEYIEKQFQPGMKWSNSDWHIDHIIPLYLAKTENEVYRLCHYTNLQPLWAKDNLLKNKKILDIDKYNEFMLKSNNKEVKDDKNTETVFRTNSES